MHNKLTNGSSSSNKRKCRRKKSVNMRSGKCDMYFSLDCEMVGVGMDGLRSALARVSIVNWENQIILDTYVKVEEEVTDYRTFVSGIKAENIESNSAMTLSQVQIAVGNILKGRILIGHGLVNDLSVIGTIHHPWCDIRDTATYIPYMRKESNEEGVILRPRKLSDLVWTNLGRQIQVIGNPHSSVEDAIAAMDLYKHDRKNWETLNQINLQENFCQAKEEAKKEWKPDYSIKCSRRVFSRTKPSNVSSSSSPPINQNCFPQYYSYPHNPTGSRRGFSHEFARTPLYVHR